eukprot:4335218-Pleurochrysis_carterae.AAC.3
MIWRCFVDLVRGAPQHTRRGFATRQPRRRQPSTVRPRPVQYKSALSPSNDSSLSALHRLRSCVTL